MIDFLQANCQKLKFRLIEKEDSIVEIIDELGLEVGIFHQLNPLSDFELQMQKIISTQAQGKNILFADGISAVLFQNQSLLPQINLTSKKSVTDVITQFLSFGDSLGYQLRKTLENFSNHKKIIFERLHGILQILGNEKKLIDFPQFIAFEELKPIPDFIKARQNFVEMCREAINPQINAFEVCHLLIQHLLFRKVFAVFFENILQKNHLYRILENITDTFSSRISQIFVLEITQLEEALTRLMQSQTNAFNALHLFEKILQQMDNQLFTKIQTIQSDEKKLETAFVFKSIDAILSKQFHIQLIDSQVSILDLNVGKEAYLMDFIHYFPKKSFIETSNKKCYTNEKSLLKHYLLHLYYTLTLQDETNKKTYFENLAWSDVLINNPQNAFKQGLLFGSQNSNAEKIALQAQQKFSVIIGDLNNLTSENLNYPEIDNSLKNLLGNEITKNKIVFPALRYIFWAGQRLSKGVLVFKLNQDMIQNSAWVAFSLILEKQYKEIYLLDFQEYNWVFMVK